LGKPVKGAASAIFQGILSKATASAPNKADAVVPVRVTFVGPLGSSIPLEEIARFLNRPVRVTVEEIQGSLELE
jgi:hypothetical protein